MTNIYDLAHTSLTALNIETKIKSVFEMKRLWDTQKTIGAPVSNIPDIAGHPENPELVPPSQVPRRRLGSIEGRAALLHAVAHIEFNAINLATDMFLRFGNGPIFETEAERSDFINDWVQVAHDETRHFMLLRDYLVDLGYEYGSFPAHNGLWEAAQKTSHDIAARLAIAPLVLEARGLDVTPPMIKKFKNIGDKRSVEILSLIYEEEVSHVACGKKWFDYVSTRRRREPKAYFHEQVKEHFSGTLKQPFNEIARLKAGLEQDYYLPLSK